MILESHPGCRSQDLCSEPTNSVWPHVQQLDAEGYTLKSQLKNHMVPLKKVELHKIISSPDHQKKVKNL